MRKARKFIKGFGKVSNRFVVRTRGVIGETKKFASSPGVKKALTGFRNYSEGFSERVEEGVTPKVNKNYKAPRLF